MILPRTVSQRNSKLPPGQFPAPYAAEVFLSFDLLEIRLSSRGSFTGAFFPFEQDLSSVSPQRIATPPLHP